MVIRALLLMACVACGDNITPPDASPCEAYGTEFPPTPDAACAGVFQFDVHTCTWSCSTWGFDAGVDGGTTP